MRLPTFCRHFLSRVQVISTFIIVMSLSMMQKGGGIEKEMLMG